MVAEVAEIAKILLSRWRDSLLTDFAGAMASVHQFEGFEEKKASQQPDQEVSTTEGAEMRSVSESLCLKTARGSSVCAHETSVHASSPIDDASRDRRNIYDSDEEEEWAALENWAAHNKLEKQIKTVNTEAGGRTATSQADLSSHKASELNEPVPTPERVQSPLDESDLSRLGHMKRFSDSSTLCDVFEENKERSKFIKTVRNAILNEGSIVAMLEVYLKFVKEHPEHDSEKKRLEFLEFLVTHGGEKDGESYPVTDALQVLKKVSLAEEKEADREDVEIDFPLEGSKNP